MAVNHESQPMSQLDINGDRYEIVDAEARAAIDKAKPVYATFTLLTSGWTRDGIGNYSSYYDVPVPGLTTADRVDVVIAPDSVIAASSCGLCPTTEALDGKFRIRVSGVPFEAITAQYQVTRG